MEVCIVRISGETICTGYVCNDATVASLNSLLHSSGYWIPRGSKYCQGSTVCCMTQQHTRVLPGLWTLVLPEGAGNGCVMALGDFAGILPQFYANVHTLRVFYQKSTVCGVCSSSWRSAPPDLASIMQGDFDDQGPADVFEFDDPEYRQPCEYCYRYRPGRRNSSGYWYCRSCWQEWIEKKAAGMQLARCAQCHQYRYSWCCRSGYSYCEDCWQEWV